MNIFSVTQPATTATYFYIFVVERESTTNVRTHALLSFEAQKPSRTNPAPHIHGTVTSTKYFFS